MKKTTAGSRMSASSRKWRKQQTTPLTVSRPTLIVNGSDAEFRSLIHDLLAYVHRLKACRDAFAAIIEVSGMQYEILMLVSLTNGLSITEIASRLHCSGAFITIEANKLVQRNILQKASDPGDGRRVLLQNTAQGAKLLRRLAPYQQRINDVLFESLDSTRFRQLRKLTSQLVMSGDRAVAMLETLMHEARAA